MEKDFKNYTENYDYGRTYNNRDRPKKRTPVQRGQDNAEYHAGLRRAKEQAE